MAVPASPTQLISAAQTLTGGWVDLGGELDMSSYTRCRVWLQIDINDSLNVRFRALAKLQNNATLEFSFPIATPSSSVIAVDDEFVEFSVDADQNILLEVVTGGSVPFLQLQVQAGTVGASPGQIDSAEATFSNS